MRRYKIVIAYDGTEYNGWQVQDNVPSIQQLVQKGIETFLRHPISLTGAGRTDAGVHALGQVAHFDTAVDFSLHKFLLAMGALVPRDIRIIGVEPVSEQFHSRYSATHKIYRYRVALGAFVLPFDRLYTLHWVGRLDMDRMKEAAALLLGTHDFRAFVHAAHTGAAAKDSIRRVDRIQILEESYGFAIEYQANGFLYKMVRNLTGMLLAVGSQRRSCQEIPYLLSGKADRSEAADTAPAHGLFLVEVGYDQFSLSKES
jgi:tRNA pseudouridine38-40 synthase